MSGAGARIAEAEAALAGLGVGAARVEAAGPEGEIAVVVAPDAATRDAVAARGPEISRRLRELGFGYVALDLGAGG